MKNKVTRIEGTDTPADTEWSDENRRKAYEIADLLSVLSGKKVKPQFMVKNKQGGFTEEEKQ